MSISLTVNRQKLIEQLQGKMQAIEEYYVASAAKLDEIKQRLLDSSGGWADYYEKVTDGLRDGTLVVEDGKIKGALNGNGRSRNPVPEKPNARTVSWGRSYGFNTAEDVQREIEQLDNYKERDLAPYKAALALLALSEDETIQINGSDYNGLLSSSVGRNFWWDR